jgi:hypothetical protein
MHYKNRKHSDSSLLIIFHQIIHFKDRYLIPDHIIGTFESYELAVITQTRTYLAHNLQVLNLKSI